MRPRPRPEAIKGKADQVDFNVLNEIFVGICIDRGIETPDFNFYHAMSTVIKEIEALAQKEEKFRETFKVANLGGIYKQLQKRGIEPNFTFARQKYLRQLMVHNQRLQFTGIPDLKEKKDITIPSVFVMQRARENIEVKDYERLMQEKEHDENNEKLLQGVQGAPWHGGPIRDGFIAEDVFDNSTCTRHLWQKRVPLATGAVIGRALKSGLR